MMLKRTDDTSNRIRSYLMIFMQISRMKALVGLILSRHLWGHTPRPSRHYRVGNHTSEEKNTMILIEGRQFHYRKGLFSKTFAVIVGPTQSIQQAQRYLFPGAKRPGFKLNIDPPLPHWSAQSGASAQIHGY